MSLCMSKTTQEMRLREFQRLQVRHPGKMLLLFEAIGKNAKVHFAALPGGATVEDLRAIAREVSSLGEKNPVLMVSDCVLSTDTKVEDLYQHYKSDDGFLHVTYSAESVMGASIAGPCFAYSEGNRPSYPGALYPDNPGVTSAGVFSK